jgi:hypothetical protein
MAGRATTWQVNRDFLTYKYLLIKINLQHNLGTDLFVDRKVQPPRQYVVWPLAR